MMARIYSSAEESLLGWVRVPTEATSFYPASMTWIIMIRNAPKVKRDNTSRVMRTFRRKIYS
jgi:hypothetical protein